MIKRAVRKQNNIGEDSGKFIKLENVLRKESKCFGQIKHETVKFKFEN